MITRRQFNIGAGSLAFAGLTLSGLGCSSAKVATPTSKGYGAPIPDPNELLDLPEGFHYEIISKLNDVMTDGLNVPDRADGMGCIPLDDDRVALIRNHELHYGQLSHQPESIQNFKTDFAYDSLADGVAVPGGTTNIVYNMKTKQIEREFVSLTGTIRNCAGGVTPWGTWLTCEENVERPNDKIKQDHGYIFEVPATATEIIEAKPLKAMGRFNHEAAAVDPSTGIVYLTEDRDDSLFYRFIPNTQGKLEDGGQLQALVIKGQPKLDSRNWDSIQMTVNTWLDAEWIDLDNPESPEDDLRIRGFEKGAVLFARGEGIHWGNDMETGRGELYFCCTSGGNKKLGQIMRYQPSAAEGQSGESAAPGRIQLFLESTDESLFNFGDNLTIAPNGHLIVCEDQYSDEVTNHLKGVTPKGEVYDFGIIRIQTEPAGVCFSPDGKVMFVNLYSPTKTLAIYGPWDSIA